MIHRMNFVGFAAFVCAGASTDGVGAAGERHRGGTPQVQPLPLNRDKQLIQIPPVTEAPLAAPKPTRIVESKGLTPVPNRFVRDRDAPLREQVFHIAETETETMVEPHRVVMISGGKRYR